MKRVLRRSARGRMLLPALALAATTGLAAQAAAVSFQTLVSVGDSLTKAQTNPFPHVARQIGVPLNNLAVNGATTTSLVNDQLDAAVALDPTFAFIWIGGNDIKNDPTGFVAGDFDLWIENYETALDALIATGADVLTANLFNLGLTPWIYQLIPNVNEPILTLVDELTRDWNARIEASAAARGVPVVDVYSLFEAMAAGDVTIAGNEFILAPDRGLGMHLFNDTQHPSLVARGVIANEIIASMNGHYGLAIPELSEARLAEIAGVPIPEPSTGLLLGLGLVGLARWRVDPRRGSILATCPPSTASTMHSSAPPR